MPNVLPPPPDPLLTLDQIAINGVTLSTVLIGCGCSLVTSAKILAEHAHKPLADQVKEIYRHYRLTWPDAAIVGRITAESVLIPTAQQITRELQALSQDECLARIHTLETRLGDTMRDAKAEQDRLISDRRKLQHDLDQSTAALHETRAALATLQSQLAANAVRCTAERFSPDSHERFRCTRPAYHPGDHEFVSDLATVSNSVRTPHAAHLGAAALWSEGERMAHDDLNAKSPHADAYPRAEQVNHPQHYGGADNVYEAIKVIEAWQLGFNLGSALKYICRAGKKGEALIDLQKARWYLDRELQQLRQQTLDARAGHVSTPQSASASSTRSAKPGTDNG